MKIVITNIVTLNGGDFAILISMIDILKKTYGETVDITVYDNNGGVASKYYPGIKYRKLLFLKYQKRASEKFSFFKNLIIKFSNIVSPERLMIAAKMSRIGLSGIGRLLLSKEQKEDFDNYASANLIISSGGTYLVENYPLTPRYFDYYFTLALRKPLIFFTQSLGPFTKAENKQSFKTIFNQSPLILLRDKASYNNLQAIGVDMSRSRVCADIVFAQADPLILENAKTKSIDRQSLKVAISVREWKFFKDRSVEKGMQAYSTSIASLCEYITITLGGRVVFLSTCQGIDEYRNDDSKFASQIYTSLCDQAKNRTTVDRNFYDPQQLQNQIKDFDLVVATRMHFAIQSLIMGVPVLPIVYEFKTKELFSKLIDQKYIVEIDKIEVEGLKNAFSQFLDDLPSFKSKLFQQVARERQSALTPIKYLLESFPTYYFDNYSK